MAFVIYRVRACSQHCMWPVCRLWSPQPTPPTSRRCFAEARRRRARSSVRPSFRVQWLGSGWPPGSCRSCPVRCISANVSAALLQIIGDSLRTCVSCAYARETDERRNGSVWTVARIIRTDYMREGRFWSTRKSLVLSRWWIEKAGTLIKMNSD